MIVFQLSGEHDELPCEEVLALYSAKGISPRVERYGKFLLVDEELPSSFLAKRLALSHSFYFVKKMSPPDKIRTLLRDSDYKNVKSYAVRAMNFDDNQKIERNIGELFLETLKIKANLSSPELEIFLIKLGEKVAICEGVFIIDKKSLAQREPQKRPFFTPVALKPKLAKLLINLSRVDEGGTLLDSFCGSGSILIEAALTGIKPTGVEKDKKNYHGARKNLEFFGLDARVILGDAREPVGVFDAIVTDPPYARSSKVFGEELLELYSDFLKTAYSELKERGRLVFAIPEDQTLDVASFGFKVLGTHKIYVHKSLTRKIFICEKK
jgi:tRNA (guanine10-N2)-dimethyltransferase